MPYHPGRQFGTDRARRCCGRVRQVEALGLSASARCRFRLMPGQRLPTARGGWWAVEAVLIVETLASGLPDMARRVLAEMVASPAIVAFRPRRATHGGAIKSPLLSQRDGMIACFARAERPPTTGFAVSPATQAKQWKSLYSEPPLPVAFLANISTDRICPASASWCT